MEFKLLGPVEVRQDAMQIPLPAREKERCLLAALLISAGQLLSKETLVSCVWGDDFPQIAEGTFRSYLTHVKRVIDAAGGQAELISRDGGYQLRVPADCVDLSRFRRFVHQSDVAVRSGNPEQAVASLYKAEALWRGPALAGLSGSWAAAVRVGLEDERRNCTLKRVGLELSLGRHAELLSELRRLRLRYPDDEICAGQEMVALYRCGRQLDALGVFRQMRNHLIEDGLEPGPELVGLHQRILARDLAKPDAMRLTRASDPGPEVPARNTAFVGRAEEIQKLTATGSVVPRTWVITGLSGVGKTRLALEAASRLAGPVLYLEFHANHGDRSPLSADTVLRSLLEMAGFHRTGLPKGQAELTALWQRETATRQMTVILDDAPDADSVERLLPEEGPCRVFITARHRLRGIVGAAELPLDVLPEGDAITLFRQISGAGNSDSLEAVAAIVRECGCMPYAITIAAGRMRSEGDTTVSAGSANPAETAGLNDHVQSVLDSALQAVPDEAQSLVRFLGMNLCSSFTVESAAVIANLPVGFANELLSVLFDCHLIEHAANGGFRLHDLLLDYAATRALEVSREERRDTERRLLDYYLSRVDRADRDLYPHRRHSVLPLPRSSQDSTVNSRRWLESEWRNVLQIAAYAGRHERQHDCAELAYMLAGFLEIEGFWEEAIDVHGQALRACRDIGDQRRSARALVDLSRACRGKGLREEALARANQALEIYRSIGDQNGEAAAIGCIGVIQYDAGQVREMQACEQDARALYLRAGDLTGEAEAGLNLGIACVELGQVDEGFENLRKSLDIFERSGNLRGAASVLNSVAEVNLREGRHRDALANYQKALSIWREMGAKQKSAIITQNIGRVYLYKNDPRRALAEFKCGLAEFRQLRDLTWQARAMCDCGDAYLALGDCGQGQVYYQEAAAAAAELGDMSVQAMALRGIADVCRESDRSDEAMRNYREALKLAQEVEEPYQRAMIMDGIAKTMLRVGKVSAGRIRLRQARDLYRAAGATEAARSADLRLNMLGDPTSDWVKLPTA